MEYIYNVIIIIIKELVTMQGKEKAIDDFDDLLRGNNQGQAENNQGALRSSFYSGANQRGALGDLQPGNNNH